MAIRADKSGEIARLLVTFRAADTGMLSGQGQGMIEGGLIPGGMTVPVTLITTGRQSDCLVVRLFCSRIVGLMAAHTERALSCINTVPVAIDAALECVHTLERPPQVVFPAAFPGKIGGLVT